MNKTATTTATKRRESLAALYFCLSLLMLMGEPDRDISILQLIIYYILAILNFLNAMRVAKKYINISGIDNGLHN